MVVANVTVSDIHEATPRLDAKPLAPSLCVIGQCSLCETQGTKQGHAPN